MREKKIKKGNWLFVIPSHSQLNEFMYKRINENHPK
jgi:hypothetical protein